MKKTFSVLLFSVFSVLVQAQAQDFKMDTLKIKEDLNEILNDISQHYIYLNEKKVNLECIYKSYSAKISQLKSEEEVVLFFEYLLDEFYDSHLILNTNRKSSFRLYSPLYVVYKDGSFFIRHVFHDLQESNISVLNLKVEKFNGVPFSQCIKAFPTYCNDKKDPEVQEWIANKIISGRYNEKRILTLKTSDNKEIDIDIDKMFYKKHTTLLSTEIKDRTGIISIHNSLGDNLLIDAFDEALDSLMDTESLIIDLRNTVDGGNSYVARGIMGRFINEPKPYQKHSTIEKYDSSKEIQRSWVEYVSPRGNQYKKPVIILVGRWTGSMGEGMAIGFDGMQRARIVGTEMERLKGEMEGFSFKHQNFGYRLSVAKLFHVNNTARENYVPVEYVKQNTILKDEALERALNLLGKPQQIKK